MPYPTICQQEEYDNCYPGCSTCELPARTRLIEFRPVVKLIDTGSRGIGLCAYQDIEAGQLIIEYVGEAISKYKFDQRVKKQKGPLIFSAVIEKDDGKKYYLDAEHKANEARFANHSCDSNAELLTVIHQRTYKVFIRAKTNISKFTEITVNYGNIYGSKGMVCNCNTARCSGYFPIKGPQLIASTKVLIKRKVDYFKSEEVLYKNIIIEQKAEIEKLQSLLCSRKRLSVVIQKSDKVACGRKSWAGSPPIIIKGGFVKYKYIYSNNFN